MWAHPTRPALQCFVSAMMALALVGVGITSMSFAAITSTTINPLAIVDLATSLWTYLGTCSSPSFFLTP